MGAAASYITPAAIAAINVLLQKFIGDARANRIEPNPVMAKIEDSLRGEQDEAEEVRARQRQQECVDRAEAQREEAEKGRLAAEEVTNHEVERRLQAELKQLEAERNLRAGIRPIVLPTPDEFNATKQRMRYQEGLIHFAVAGTAGSGKSSLVNAFRGLRNSRYDPLAAPTGIVETTSEVRRYADPDTDKPFVWYDIPGAGTLRIPDWSYFNAQGLYIFDSVFVLFDNRFTETDVAILKNCALFNIPVYIVRSKSTQHIQNVLNDMEDEEDGVSDLWAKARSQYISETRQSVARNLEEASLPQQKIYLIDKDNLTQIINKKKPRGYIDEWGLMKDLLADAAIRRTAQSGWTSEMIRILRQSDVSAL